jgi:acyl-CoA reductase-like NAD-dependent aldehyde dehydrogenase
METFPMATPRAALVIRSPLDQQVIGELPYDTPQQLDDKLAAARAAQQQWRGLKLEERAAQVREGLSRLRDDSQRIAEDVTRQMGKPLAQAKGELETLFARAEQSLRDAPAALAADVLTDQEGFVRRIELEPLGAVLVIAAWNYPLIIPINVIVPALLAGNVVILKHSGRTPLTGEAFERAFGELDVPNLVTSVVLSHEQTAALIDDERIDHVSFTGSVDGGRQVYQSVARRFIGVGLELGGKDPAYVAADADLDFAVANLVDGACYNAGQSCCAIERVYVHESLYGNFVAAVYKRMQDYRLGDPMDETTTMGPMASAGALDELERQVSDAVGRGAKLLLGGERLDDTAGNFFPPTLVVDVPQDAMIIQEESFGPVMPVASVANDEEALERMNDTRFGLTASVWTSDLERAERFGGELRTGTVMMNRCDSVDPALPWTGIGESGLGSSLSRFGFYHLTRRKSIHFRTAIDGG